ncbi:MAG: CRTAC1 family protein [Kangiellaceae bacterium]|nr:CRTAC1 family protein [Kangiellaceae bacterium]
MFRKSLLALLVCAAFQAYAAESTSDIINKIKELESDRDPKCYATASRLEDFIFGTPLSAEARFEKNIRQKDLAAKIWLAASATASARESESVSVEDIDSTVKNLIKTTQNARGHWDVKLPAMPSVQIHKDDKRQYSTIAYSLRAILAVQQDLLLGVLEDDFLPMDEPGISRLKDIVDFYTLVILKVSDEKARKESDYEISQSDFVSVWNDLTPKDYQKKVEQRQVARTKADFKILKSSIEQKLASYKNYNNVNNQLFVRNLQVYFARNRWPSDANEAKEFRALFTESLIQFSKDLYSGAEKLALAENRNSISEKDVYTFAKQFIPHEINEYEDAIFFPNLSKEKRVYVESYDMDAFRDSGLHWQYLGYAISDKDFSATLAPDPFAAELITENIAQFGVLILRLTGMEGKALGENRIAKSHFFSAWKSIQNRVEEHKTVKPRKVQDQVVSSGSKQKQKTKFVDITAQANVDMTHRSSDWLNRLLRSYLKKDENTGVITIPPAFGGSGVAAEDINEDGYVDLLVLSGSGNKLYLNQQGKSFKDITKEAGLDWVRSEDNNPGEPRQPIIADIDNDGLQDIIITYVNDAHRVYRNLGDAKFEDVTDIAKLGGAELVGGPATVFDYDNDGDLDFYVTYFGNYLKGVLPTLKRKNFNGLPNKLFENQGNFKFKDVSKGSGVENTGWGQAVTHTDFNRDGWQDLIVGNDFGVNSYYKNNGDGTFTDLAYEMGTDKASYTMGIGLSDLNDDLHPDVYISNIVTMNKDEKYVLPSEETTMKFNPAKLATMRVIEANDLFLSVVDGKQLTYDHSYALERGDFSTGWSWDADFFDADNDGDDDLYVLNGMNEFNVYSNENPYYQDPLSSENKNVYIPVSTKETNVFFTNDGGKLRNTSKDSGLDFLGNSRSAAYFDFENDGDLDLILHNYHEQTKVFSNNAETLKNSWMKVKLIGNLEKKVTRDAIGARIIVKTDSGNTIWREVSSTIGYMSVHPKQQHIGLGNDKIVELIVEWPNGDVSRLENVKANQSLEIVQD